MATKFFVFAAFAVSCALAFPGHAVDYYVRNFTKFREALKF